MNNSPKSKSWEELTFADNFMFCKILESEPELCKELIELLLHVKIDHLEFPQSEKTMDEFPDAKSIRLDVYTKDDKRIFDLEMQAIDTKNLGHRARYYQSIIDMDNLSKGENYSHLKDSYVIFICLKDIFDKGLPVYSFENICTEDTSLPLNDGTFKVFFNAEDCDKLKSEKERDFFKFLKGQGAESDFSKRLESKVLLARKNAIWRKQYMTWQQTIDEEKEIAFQKGKDAGITQGQNEAQISAAKNLLRMNLGTLEQIAEAADLPLETVLELKASL
ncbi:MAG: Rpn family recombination-promoting nuclease/putative transposase [Treponema sp.]|nr:Rpn family recombination-promoting nuclease/putative transposase [Treponema sp.]